MTPQNAITTARDIINDTDPAAYRQSNDEMVRYYNDGLREISTLAPQLFVSTGDMQCAPAATEQGIAFADAQLLADVVRVKAGRAVLPCDMTTLSAFNPNWGQDVAAEAVNWFRHASDPLRFYIYPQSPVDQVLEVKYYRSPAVVALTDSVTDIPQSMEPAMVNYLVYRAEMKDDEHVNSGRSVASYQAFLALVKPA